MTHFYYDQYLSILLIDVAQAKIILLNDFNFLTDLVK